MLPKVVWEMPSLGTVFCFTRELSRCLCSGQSSMVKLKRVSPFFIDDKIDTGAMILSSEIPIDERNAGHLHDRLMELGSKTVIDTLEMIEKMCPQ
jgi:methionyl-tRNA formyltransferase